MTKYLKSFIYVLVAINLSALTAIASYAAYLQILEMGRHYDKYYLTDQQEAVLELHKRGELKKYIDFYDKHHKKGDFNVTLPNGKVINNVFDQFDQLPEGFVLEEKIK